MPRGIRTIVRNVHREPVGPHVDYEDLTEECKESLEPEVITDVEGIAIIHSIFGIEQEDGEENG